MSDIVIITAIVCVTIVSIVAIFAILAYLKERAVLNLKNSFKDVISEIAVSVDSNKDKNSKK